MEREQKRVLIQDLVNRFVSRQDEYESGGYLESQLRTDFINELFLILGWDITNKANLSPLSREVLVEKGETKGRPDYSFRVNGEDTFFVEAKAVSKGTDKPDDIFQAKRYGWNTRKVNIAILTDFKTFKVFDASLKPTLNQPNVGLLFELKCAKFATADFDKLWMFSRGEVIRDSLNKLMPKDAASKRLRIPVDTAFLEQMTFWREMLAKDIYKNNSEITVGMLNDVVQRLLDRLVFIRILEDRKIIESKTLRDIAENWREAKHRDIQMPLNALFRKLNEDFNGNIFKPHPCETTAYSSGVVAEIIDDLYYPKSPYDFAVLGVDLLGVIYEKYLGKTIRLTEKRVKVEEKPEVRKAGGVYYTPKWVVNYIVDNTVGELIKNKKPEEIAKLRILDPACGSGSFLIGTLEKLFLHHLRYYSERPKEGKAGTLFPLLVIERDEDGNVMHRLSIETKSQILSNNIYGVDIDPQAVEITMMSLYIKILEGEKTLPHNKELLPSLSNNIRCGNSLIGFDFLEQKTLVKDLEKERANPFEWRSKTTGFGNIIGEKDGFDAIVGNPPYIRIQTMKEWAPKEVEYFSRKYKTAASGNYDIYVVFVERAIELLSGKGLFGFIMPHKFFQAEYGANLRKLIAEGKLLREIVNFRDQQVFDQATTYTHLLFLSKAENKTFKYAEISKLENPASLMVTIKNKNEYQNHAIQVGVLPVTMVTQTPWQFGFGAETAILSKLNSVPNRLADVASRIFQGLVTGADPVFILERKSPVTDGKLVEVYSKALGKNFKIEAGILKPLLKGEEIKRYSAPDWEYWIIFPYNIVNGKADAISKEEMENKYPKAWQYLNENKKKLQERDRGKLKVEWYVFARTQNIEQFYEPKIMTQVLAKHASFTLDKEGLYYFVGGGNAGGYGVKLKPEYGLDPLYVTGLLNSKVLEFYLKKVSTPFRGGFYSYAKRFIAQLPIHLPDGEGQAKAEEVASLVDKILDLNKKQAIADASRKELLGREAGFYEEKINKLVYEIYGITESEKKIIEESLK